MQDMTTPENKLFHLASEARNKAYVPYSKFAVGAAVLSSDGSYYGGCNVENVSYPCGTCAEAGAIAAMICGGSKKIAKILIIADAPQLITPCGACLQRIKEFSDSQTEVLLAAPDGIKQRLTVAQLLPHDFDNSELRK